jgi:hypothetical protein
MKNSGLWVVRPCGSCKNRRFGRKPKILNSVLWSGVCISSLLSAYNICHQGDLSRYRWFFKLITLQTSQHMMWEITLLTLSINVLRVPVQLYVEFHVAFQTNMTASHAFASFSVPKQGTMHVRRWVKQQGCYKGWETASRMRLYSPCLYVIFVLTCSKFN